MIKHLQPFSKEHIDHARSLMTPEEYISECVRNEILLFMENLVFETNDEKERKKAVDHLNTLNENVKFEDITTINDVDNASLRIQGSMKMNNDDIKIFSVSVKQF